MIFYTSSYFLPKKNKTKIDLKKPLPGVSIIVPAWNEEKGIGRTIESLIKIDYPLDKLEIIVVDDGSTDKTYEAALKYKSRLVKVFRKKENGGKFTALNYGIEKSKGEIIVSTDADDLEVMSDALKKMVRYFQNPKVMCVAPTMAILNPHGVLARVQQVEYLLGVFLRRAFANMNAMHVTPGAFSAYRKSFMEKYGLFKHAYLTEDMEMALRIQKHGYIIENSIDSVIYTRVPTKFKPLVIQRRRWYSGLLRNLWDYRELFTPKYGIMALFVLPMAIVSIITTMIFTTYLSIKTIERIQHNLALMNLVDFNVFNFQFDTALFQRVILRSATTPLTLFTIFFVIILASYMIFAKKWVKKNSRVALSLVLFFFIYSFLSFVWWTVSLFYTAFARKKIVWR